MSDRIEPRKADFRVWALRVVVRVFFGLSQLRRRPARPPGALTLHRYGDHPAENLESIEPRPGSPRRSPIVYIHGGGWIAGRKESYTRYLSFLGEVGHPIYNLEYPLAPENPHPGILRSLLRALDWIHEKHPEVEGVHLMGDSAGGNLVMMLGLFATNPELMTAVDPERKTGFPIRCKSVVSLYGVLDRLSWIEDGFPGADVMLRSYAGEAAFEPEVGPELAITPMDLDFTAAPPTLLAVGTEDQLHRSSLIFAERLAAGPGKVVLKEYPGEGHAFFNLGKTHSDDELGADILEFLDGVE
jgi:acetyl esterase/lipase